jgi:hypothetical protein
MPCCGDGWTKYVETEIWKFYTDKVAPLVRVEVVALEEKLASEIAKLEAKIVGFVEQKVQEAISGASKD